MMLSPLFVPFKEHYYFPSSSVLMVFGRMFFLMNLSPQQMLFLTVLMDEEF